MNILFICLENYPKEGACTSLLLNLLSQKEMRDLGEVHVLSLAKEENVSHKEDYEGIHIHRFRSITRMTNKEIMFEKVPLIKKIREIWFRIKRRFPSIFRNSNLFYNQVLVEETEKVIFQILKEHYIDLIIPICGYYESAVATLDIYQKKGIHFGIYQVDPCSTNTVLPPASYNDRITFEKTIYDYANFVITTPINGQEMKQYLTDKQLKKMWEMEFPNVVPRYSNIQIRNDFQIKCLYAGKIYAGARNPRFTIELFSHINDPNIVLEMIGVERNVLAHFMDSNIPDRIICRGNMSIDKTREEIENADILVNIGNIMKNQIPSKIFEYISSGKPIINICYDKECPSIPYIERYPNSINIYQSDEKIRDIDSIAHELEDFIYSHKNRVVPKEKIESLFFTCTPKYCASLMSGIILDSLKN